MKTTIGEGPLPGIVVDDMRRWAELEAERDRYRKALELIAEILKGELFATAAHDPFDEMEHIAKEALKDGL